MNKAEWASIEKELSGHYGQVRLRIGGRVITLARQLVSKNRLAIVTYIDGKLEARWCMASKPCPEQQFWRRVEKYAYSAKDRATLLKMGKKWLAKKGYNPNIKTVVYAPTWSSVDQLRRHYQKQFGDAIELVFSPEADPCA